MILVGANSDLINQVMSDKLSATCPLGSQRKISLFLNKAASGAMSEFSSIWSGSCASGVLNISAKLWWSYAGIHSSWGLRVKPDLFRNWFLSIVVRPSCRCTPRERSSAVVFKYVGMYRHLKWNWWCLDMLNIDRTTCNDFGWAVPLLSSIRATELSTQTTTLWPCHRCAHV